MQNREQRVWKMELCSHELVNAHTNSVVLKLKTESPIIPVISMFPPNTYILETSSLNSYTNGIWDMAFGRQLTLVKS